MTWTARIRLNPNFINIYNRRCQCLDIQSFLVLRVTQGTRKLQRKLVNCENTEIHRDVAYLFIRIDIYASLHDL